jgi:tRNA(fMet)-specific endonuclease VapC
MVWQRRRRTFASTSWCSAFWGTRLLAWGEQAADIHAEIKFQLRSAGTPIGEMDTLIAAHAIAADAVLVTNKTRHFQMIQLPLMLENWAE